MKNQKIILLFLIVMILSINKLPWTGFIKLAMADSSVTENENRSYRNFSTAPSYIKIKLKDSGQEVTLILENGDFLSFYAEKQGFTINQSGKFNNSSNFKQFVENDYIPMMIKNQNKVFDIELKDIANFFAKTHGGSSEEAMNYLRSQIVKTPLSLSDLQVNSEKEMIERYFDFQWENRSGL